MVVALAAALVGAPLILAGERDFFHIPSEREVRLQTISKTANETGWPFSVDTGYLTCVWSVGQPVAMFFANTGTDEAPQSRGVILSVDPLQLTLGNMRTRDLFLPSETVEERIRAVAPFVTMGMKLCEQPSGARIGHGEL